MLVSPRLKGLNTPMKIYSYLDSGVAVLATKLPTHTQVLDQRTAYLVEPEADDLGRGLAELMRDPDLRTQLATEAKDYVRREFTPEAARRKLATFYAAVEARAGERVTEAREAIVAVTDPPEHGRLRSGRSRLRRART